MPTAPYPPMISSRYPSAHVSTMRSSMTTSPHYASGAAAGFARIHTEQPQRSLSDDRYIDQQQVDNSGGPSQHGSRREGPHHHSAATTPSATGTGDSGPSKTASSQNQQQQLRCRVQFANANLVACINCMDIAVDTSPIEINTPRIHRKLGPILMEMRQLQYSAQTSASSPELFTTRTMALSRGNPSLGTSVSSTCLDVSSILPVTTYSSHANSLNRPPPCATGLTTGALCIHTFTESSQQGSSADDDFAYSSQIEYFHTPRHHRQATAVSWRRHNSRHVAIGLVSSAMAGPNSSMATASGRRAPNNPALVGKPAGGGDREFCCFLWDIEHQSSGTRKTNTSPLFKLSHNAGVASLAWLLEGGQTLAVGGQQRNIQLYDLRVSGTSSATPPISALCHNFGVHGIEVDPFRPHQFATFCRAAGEPVKIWDARHMESAVSEIKLPSSDNLLVSSLRWSSREAGVLSVALGDLVQDYDTSSRPVLIRVNRAKAPILDMALYPGSFPKDPAELPAASTAKSGSDSILHSPNQQPDDLRLISELYPQRMLVVLSDQMVHDQAKHSIAPLAVSRRDGRVVHALGKHLFLGSTRDGPSAMERGQASPDEDISATMMRRARCLQQAKYSMDTKSNIKILANEIGPERDALLRLWTWIDRIESLANSAVLNTTEELGATSNPMDDGGLSWASKGLDEAGVWKLLQMGEEKPSDMTHDSILNSDSLACNVYDSPVRRYVLHIRPYCYVQCRPYCYVQCSAVQFVPVGSLRNDLFAVLQSRAYSLWMDWALQPLECSCGV